MRYRFEKWGANIFLAIVLFAFFRYWWVGQQYDPSIGINILVVAEEKLAVLAVRPKEELLVWVEIPENLKIPIARMNGATYQTSGLWHLAEIEKKTLVLPREVVGESLGVVLPSVVKINGGLSVGNLSSKMLALSTITNLKWGDRFRIRGDIARLTKNNKLLEVDLPKQVMVEVEETDGKVFSKLNTAIFNWSQDQWVSELILKDGVRAMVFNASDFKGLGLSASRQLESAGIKVVGLSGGEKIESRSGCRFKIKDKNKITKQLIEKHFLCEDGGVMTEEESNNYYGANLMYWVTNRR